jgi:hypothetical protein
MNTLPSRSYQDTCEFRSSIDQKSILDPVVNFHEFTHCVEILTNRDNPPPPPEFRIGPYQILLDHLAFRDPDIVADLFSPSTVFASLAPIDAGNGLFAQKGVITITVNDSTYRRFGLIGVKFQNGHFIVIREDQRQLLQKIRPCQPIEGILITENISVYEPHIRKFRPVDFAIDFWSPAKDFEFDIESLKNPDPAYAGNWRSDFIHAIDQVLLSKSETVIASSVQRITIQGFFPLSLLKSWIEELATSGWSLLLVWDMVDIPASFLGEKHTLRGVGGGCEAVLFGAELPRALRFQTVNFVES